MRSSIAAMMAAGMLVPGAQAHQSSPVQANQSGKASCVNDPSWMAPQKPFQIYGNTWYVGTRGISALLLKSPTGHVLMDVGVAESVPLIEANLRSLGINLHDIWPMLAACPRLITA